MAAPVGLTGLTGYLLAYLQRAGLKTLVVEQADRVGGMARTEAGPTTGFEHNPLTPTISHTAA